MHPGHPILGWTGFGFVLIIDDLPPQQPRDVPEEDVTSVLQRSMHAVPIQDSTKVQEERLQLRFAEASQALDKLDTHFTLPVFDLEAVLEGHAQWLPQCLPWIRDEWYAWDQPFEHVSVYYDGSFLPKEGTAGAAAAAFVLQGRRWLFAGAVSAHLPSPEFGSYTAEVRAALLATKQAYDLVKIAVEVFGAKPSVSFLFDSLSLWVSRQKVYGKPKKTRSHAMLSAVSYGYCRLDGMLIANIPLFLAIAETLVMSLLTPLLCVLRRGSKCRIGILLSVS